MAPGGISAAQAIQRFRARQISGLLSHLRKQGPLPTVSGAEGSTPSIVLPNPFVPLKARNGNWRAPKVSLRRQADLVKQAQALGVLGSMPPGPKTQTLEMRMKRLQLGSPVAAPVDAVKSKTPPISTSTTPKKPASTIVPESKSTRLNREKEDSKEKLETLKAELDSLGSQHDIDQLIAFEKRKGETQDERKARYTREAYYLGLEGKIRAAEAELTKAERRVLDLEHAEQEKEKKRVELARWKNPVWVGEVKQKPTKGTELGTRLYAGKKKMFKGHLWERQRAKRVRRQGILMRDMAARVARYKAVSCILHLPRLILIATHLFSVLQSKETQPSQAFEVYEAAQVAVLVVSLQPLIIHHLFSTPFTSRGWNEILKSTEIDFRCPCLSLMSFHL